MTQSVPTTANEFIEQQLDVRLLEVEKAFDVDALCIVGDLRVGMDDLIRTVIEELKAKEQSQRRLVVILTTNGGYIEPVQRIVETIRHHYSHVSFVIPDQAYSAGTVLALSGDDIWMNYYSRLGPIDPQVPTPRGRWVPALGYVRKWEQLVEKAEKGELTAAEFQLMVDGFDQAELYKYEQSRALTVRLLREWLVTYKFKNWDMTEHRQEKVTPKMRKDRAEAIALGLNNTDRWNSHGSGISKGVLWDELKLLIDDLDKDSKGIPVKEYHNLLKDYMMRLGDSGILHTTSRYLHVM